MLREQQGYKAHQGASRGVGGCIGTGGDCRYSGAKRGIGAPRDGKASGVY